MILQCQILIWLNLSKVLGFCKEILYSSANKDIRLAVSLGHDACLRWTTLAAIYEEEGVEDGGKGDEISYLLEWVNPGKAGFGGIGFLWGKGNFVICIEN